MTAPSVNLTRLSLSGKTVAVIVAFVLIVGFLLMLLWPSVRSVGEQLGGGIKRQTDKVTTQASTRAQSASAGMM